MCKAIEDMRNEATAKATRETTLKFVRGLLVDGRYNHKEIALLAQLPLEEIQQLAAEMQAQPSH